MTTLETIIDSDRGEDHGRDVAATPRRAPRISQEDVFKAADQLLIEGNRPTIDRVRMRLGRGSPNTINDHLDAWWTKLGARLRDLPGREFPQLPERVAQGLQHLWNEALEGAHETLQGTLIEREQALTHRERDLESHARQLSEREQAGAARAAGLEESLALAREQLSAANRRAEMLETALQERDGECGRLRTRMEVLEASLAELRGKLDAVTTAHQAERTKLAERYSAAEARWLTEVDRARQVAKETAKEHRQQVQEWRNRAERSRTELDHLQQELLEVRSEVKAASAVREQLEQRLRVLANRVSDRPDTGRPKVKRSRKPTRKIPEVR